MLDRCFQVAYCCAYALLRFYWALRHPLTHGALVAVWHAGRVLVVRNSYTSFYTAPGGYVRGGENTRRAAARELAEEVGIAIDEQQLTPALEVTHYWDHKHDHVCLYRLDLPDRPTVRIDNREVIEAGFYTPELALNLDLFPPLRRHIEAALHESPETAPEPADRTNALRPAPDSSRRTSSRS